MGPEGYALNSIAVPGCSCTACELTNMQMESQGHGRVDDRLEISSISPASHDYRHWERDLLAHQEQMAGVPLDQQTYQ